MLVAHPRLSRSTTTVWRELSLTSVTVLLHWATWESAQLCVNSKLRTPLGKPVDTFMAFEGVLKSLARQTVGSQTTDTTDEFDVCRVRLLLELVEQLEKAMYNASDGTASALIAPSKSKSTFETGSTLCIQYFRLFRHWPVRSFFHTNKSTCHEWLSRNRSAVVAVALRAGMASCAVRHGYTLLQDLLDLGNTKGSEFENAVLQVAWALLKLKQSEPIQGLYVWCRDIIESSSPV
ncbi:serine/threonine-protein kinase SMG1-like [Homalodisca vitripennis]|uniref:serine/threonine-protein kinase SMG1-like n=1 Tax=Homalodisca vitripennis TaxID=197043 RepID=UPI001EEC1622|nr:serine/threonine-protein kinase SMG1-like [Homalodisca vitripennis]